MEKLYDVLPGFDWVAGQRVPETRQVRLTDEAAEFDILLGRIEPAAETVDEVQPIKTRIA